MMKLNEIRLSASVTLVGAGLLSVRGVPLDANAYATWYHAFSYVTLTIALCLVAAMVSRHPIMLGLYGLIATATGVVGALALWEAGISGGGALVPESSMRIVSLTLLAGAPLVLLLSLLSSHRHSDTVMYVALAAGIPLLELSTVAVAGWPVSGWLLVIAGLSCAAGLRARRTTEALAQPQPWVAA